jgi:hypothetical protein
VLIQQLTDCHGWIDQTETAAEMHAFYTLNIPKRTSRSPKWPKTPAAFATELRRLAPIFEERGLFVIFTRTRTARFITLTTRPERRQPEATVDAQMPDG